MEPDHADDYELGALVDAYDMPLLGTGIRVLWLSLRMQRESQGNERTIDLRNPSLGDPTRPTSLQGGADLGTICVLDSPPILEHKSPP